MKTNKAGLDLIKRYEGLELEAYQDPVGVWTIGYGHTRNVKPGDTISEDDAEALLEIDLEEAESVVRRGVYVDLNPNQFSALVSFVYNLGSGNFSRSTLRKKVNDKDFEGAAEELKRWNKAGGEVLPGLVARRAAEEELFRREVKPLGQSRTIRAASTTTIAATTLGAVSETMEQIQPTLTVTQQLAEWAPTLALIIFALGMLAVVYARHTDSQEGLR